MIAPDMAVIDIDPQGFAAFRDAAGQISQRAPQAVLWHEDGIPRRFVLGGESLPFGISRVLDARQSAMAIYENSGRKVRRVIVMDRQSYDNLCRIQGREPVEAEPRYEYLGRVLEAINASQDRNLGIYPLLSLDRGPVAYESLRDFFSGTGPARSSLLMAVFAENRLRFSLVARVEDSLVNLVTSLDHWEGRLEIEAFSVECLYRAVEAVSTEFGPMAGALFIQEQEFKRLYNGKRHDSLPSPLLIPDHRAFGYSPSTGEHAEAMLCTAGLFAYVPDWFY